MNTDIAMEAQQEPLIFEADMEDIVNGFVTESTECLEKLDSELMALEQSPNDQELLKSIFRKLHTIKGNSKALDLEKINILVHRVEDIVRLARDSKAAITPQALDAMFTAADIIKKLVLDVAKRIKSSIDTEPVLNSLNEVLEGKTGTSAQNAPQKLVIEDDMKEIVDGFVMESEELLSNMDKLLLKLETSPDDLETTGAVFRHLHTLKGNSRSLGFTLLEELSHKTEDIIRAVRDKKISLTPESTNVIIKSADNLKLLVSDVKNRVVSSLDLVRIKNELALALAGKTDDLRAMSKQNAPANSTTGSGGNNTQSTIRVDVEKLDNLVRSTGELVLTRNRLLNFIEQMEHRASSPDMPEKLSEISAQLNIMVSGLQLQARTTRMQPIGKIFARYPRVIRDLSKDLDKEMDLVTSGESTELDNAIIEDIGDPLIHLVRNCCDHGIEKPEIREQAGKARRGRIELSARQEGNSIVIEIIDDGKGMDPAVLMRAAVSKGVITEDQAHRMTDAEALNLIFAPGFSTAEKVTAVSGRGVGMDVVKNSIAKLNGIIDIESVVGKGTKLRIQLPLTMAVTTALEIETGTEKYLVLQESVVEIMRVPKEAYDTVQSEHRFLFRNRFSCPLIDLREVLDIKKQSRDDMNHGYILVFGRAEQRTGVLVDNVLQQHEVVIKPLGDYISAFSLMESSGAAIMGDGNVELILNSGYLLDSGFKAANA